MEKLKHIPFEAIESIPQLIKDFLTGKLDQEFGSFRFGRENFENQIKHTTERYSNEQREALVESLRIQHSTLPLDHLQEENIEKLKESDTFTVVTGHQLNLFTGPVFFIYKILQTIKTATYLKELFPEKHFVPLFWMASEDHDFDEINHFKTWEHYYEIKGKAGGAVGRIQVEDQFFLHQFEKEFEDTTYGTELIHWMKEAYSMGSTLSEATKKLVQRLFSSYGLLILDGDDRELKKQMVPIFREELKENALFEFSKEKVSLLKEKYKKVQVNPREINLFYLGEERDRIENFGEKFKLADKNKTWEKDEIENELELHPERFSPNALLRPVYQETILPNLAYIGGNAEIMYWLEVKDYFEHLGARLPVLIPRNSLAFLTKKQLRKVEKLGLSIEDLFGNFARVSAKELLEDSVIQKELTEKKLKLKNMFAELKEKATLTDVTFSNLLAAEETRQLKSFWRMEKRLLRAEKIKQSEKLTRLENLYLDFHPSGNWQERVVNFSVFYADNGREWLHNCYSHMQVDKSGINILLI